MKLKSIIKFCIILLWLYSCNNKKNPQIANEYCCHEDGNPLNIVNWRDTLKIIVQDSYCGEWGGRKEYTYIQRNENREIYARFIVDTVSCDRIVEKNGAGVLDYQERIVVFDTTKLLRIEEQQKISELIQRLVKVYLKPELHGNFGSYFEVINTDGTLKLSYWNSGNCCNTFYWETRKQIFNYND